MKFTFTSFLFVLLIAVWLPVQSQHTFSIVAADPLTGEVGSAGATCLNNSSCNGCGGAIIISGIIPGRGAANAQATVCIPNVNLNSILTRMSQGSSAMACLSSVLTFDGCQFGDTSNRQYGIVDLDSSGMPRVASFTGSSALSAAGHRTGPNYSIQGNILLGEFILDSMEARFNAASGPLCEKLMAALQGANVAGADSRCLQDGVSSESAFIRVARPNDLPNQFWMDLNVPEVAVGVEPIDSLQNLFDEFKATVGLPPSPAAAQLFVYPNPGNGQFNLDYKALDPIAPVAEIYDLQGQLVRTRELDPQAGKAELDLRDLPAQGLFVVYRDLEAGISVTRKILLKD
ncbi:MAG: DUF1028 domain-containing protein [Bacteroidota bacterium]